MSASDSAAPHPSELGARASEVIRCFLRLGFIAFGGPAAHIALMRRELVAERKWVTDAEFVDLLGITNLIPGPNSTEMAMHLGATRGGWRGLWLAGLFFIGPAVLIVLGLAWAYAEYGSTPPAEGILFGIQPVVLAIILQAIWGLRGAAVKGPPTLVVVCGVLAFAFAGADELVLLLASGGAVLVFAAAGGGRGREWPAAVRAGAGRVRRWRPGGHMFVPLVPLDLPLAAAAHPGSSNLLELFLVFLKIGGLLYGSGYVLVSFMQAEFVDSRGWLTQQELLDAVAVGQFTPGPLFSSATFAGYLIDGLPGAAVATAGIFLPSFLFVAISHPCLPRLRSWRWTAPFLDGVNAAAVALMAVVTVEIARETLDNTWQLGLLGLAAIALLRFNPNSAWLVLAGALVGLLRAWANG